MKATKTDIDQKIKVLDRKIKIHKTKLSLLIEERKNLKEKKDARQAAAILKYEKEERKFELVDELIHQFSCMDDPEHYDGCEGFKDGEYFKRAMKMFDRFSSQKSSKKTNVIKTPDNKLDLIVLGDRVENIVGVAYCNDDEKFGARASRLLSRLKTKLDSYD